MSRRKKVIPFRQSLFWDVDPKTINPKKHARYIIERILEFGTDTEIKWMWSFYSKDLIHDVVENRRGLRLSLKPLWKALTSEAR